MRNHTYRLPKTLLGTGVLAVAVLLSCQMDGDKQWSNPADPEGVNYHSPRVRVESDSLFVDSSDVTLRVVATSPNAQIAKIQWSVDGLAVATVEFNSSDSVMDLHVPGLLEAPHVVAVQVQDGTGLWSVPDTVCLRVWNEPPKLSKVRDTCLATGQTLSVTLVATDFDGTVAQYRFDTAGGRWASSSTAPTLDISSTMEGGRAIVWEAHDDLGKTSLDTFVVIFTEKPVLTLVSDTVLSASKTLSIALIARDIDPSGHVETYLWSTSGSGWTDSSSDGKLSLAGSTGGTTTVRWAVRNDQGKLSIEDTFTVSFVPAPVITSVQVDSFLTDWTGLTGTVNAIWSGAVPGFASEAVIWTLWFGPAENVEPVYQGAGTSWSGIDLDSGMTFQYALVGTNRFGDGVIQAGSVRTRYALQPKTSYGIPWNPSVTYGYFTDKRDNQGYYTVTIAGQTWMAQNLNYAGSGVCYNSSADSCSKYGRLYTWSEVMQGSSSSSSSPSGVQGVCPDGWHVPSDAEWQSLEVAVGMAASSAASTVWRGTTEGAKLKSTLGWNNSGNGLDDYGFRVLPAGYVNGGESLYASSLAFVWTASEDGTSLAWFRNLSDNYANVYRGIDGKTRGFSLRCRQN